MIYGLFARVYDELMDKTLYEKWVQYVDHYLTKKEQVLELGCGSGQLGLELKKTGYDVTGLDLSNEMLSLAYNRQLEENITFPLIEGDMRDLSELGNYDAIISFCDSLCYLEKKDDMKKVFSEVFEKLNDGGFFLFDVHSIYQMEQFFDFSFHAELDDLVFLWDSDKGEHTHSVEHYLTFFKEKNENDYERFEELHRERTYSIDDYKCMLKQAGFSAVVVKADFDQDVSEKSKRWFFKAEK